MPTKMITESTSGLKKPRYMSVNPELPRPTDGFTSAITRPRSSTKLCTPIATAAMSTAEQPCPNMYERTARVRGMGLLLTKQRARAGAGARTAEDNLRMARRVHVPRRDGPDDDH
jgi:hypothetical protein